MELFNWFEARNRLKCGICKIVTHTEVGTYRTHWHMRGDILYCVSRDTPQGRESNGGPAGDRKLRKIFHEVATNIS